MKRKSEISLYGNVAMARQYCPACKQTSLIINDRLACCDSLAGATSGKVKRMSLPFQGRKLPSRSAQLKILAGQGDRCFYCEMSLGSVKFRHGLPVVLKLNWDHSLPYAYSQNNNNENFVAACHVCNGIKSDKVFQTLDEARIYLQDKRKSKGYNF